MKNNGKKVVEKLCVINHEFGGGANFFELYVAKQLMFYCIFINKFSKISKIWRSCPPFSFETINQNFKKKSKILSFFPKSNKTIIFVPK